VPRRRAVRPSRRVPQARRLFQQIQTRAQAHEGQARQVPFLQMHPRRHARGHGPLPAAFAVCRSFHAQFVLPQKNAGPENRCGVGLLAPVRILRPACFPLARKPDMPVFQGSFAKRRAPGTRLGGGCGPCPLIFKIFSLFMEIIGYAPLNLQIVLYIRRCR